MALQESASGLLSYADRRVRELKTHYETKLGWARHEAEQIVEMNEWLSEQLHLQSGVLRDLAVADVPSTDWLMVRPRPPRTSGWTTRASGRRAEEQRIPAPSRWRTSEVSGELAGDDEDEAEARAASDEDDRRRDEGFDEPPRTRAPLWLVELEASD